MHGKNRVGETHHFPRACLERGSVDYQKTYTKIVFLTPTNSKKNISINLFYFFKARQ